MALKKTIASYIKEVTVMTPIFDMDGNFLTNENGTPRMQPVKEFIEIPQLDIEMHPIEEAEILATWAVGDIRRRMPKPISIEEEHEMLIGNGFDFVKQKRKEHKELVDSFQPELLEAHNKHQEAHRLYQEWMSGDGEKWHNDLMGNNEATAINIHVVAINENIAKISSSLKAQAQERRLASEAEEARLATLEANKDK